MGEICHRGSLRRNSKFVDWILRRNFDAILINLTTYSSRNDNNNTLRAFDAFLFYFFEKSYFILFYFESWTNQKNLHEVSANEHCILYRDNKSVIILLKKKTNLLL